MQAHGLADRVQAVNRRQVVVEPAVEVARVVDAAIGVLHRPGDPADVVGLEQGQVDRDVGLLAQDRADAGRLLQHALRGLLVARPAGVGGGDQGAGDLHLQRGLGQLGAGQLVGAAVPDPDLGAVGAQVVDQRLDQRQQQLVGAVELGAEAVGLEADLHRGGEVGDQLLPGLLDVGLAGELVQPGDQHRLGPHGVHAGGGDALGVVDLHHRGRAADRRQRGGRTVAGWAGVRQRAVSQRAVSAALLARAGVRRRRVGVIGAGAQAAGAKPHRCRRGCRADDEVSTIDLGPLLVAHKLVPLVTV